MGGHLNLDGGTLTLDGGTRSPRAPYNLSTGYTNQKQEREKLGTKLYSSEVDTDWKEGDELWNCVIKPYIFSSAQLLDV